MYAAGANLSYANKDLNKVKSKINEDFSKIESWLKGINCLLTWLRQSMVIGSNHLLNNVTSSTDFEISKDSIDQVTSTKYLGVQIDYKLCWKKTK